MKRYNLIAGINRSGVIGVDGKIPWSYPEDLAHFKKVTSSKVTSNPGGYPISSPGNAVIMGRKTWESLNGPLAHRHSIVLSNKIVPSAYNAPTEFVDSIEAACEVAADYDEVFIIGGSEVYRQFLEMDLIEKLIITEIQSIIPFNGVHFPIELPFEINDTWDEDYSRPSLTGFSLNQTEIKNGLYIHTFVREGSI